MLFLAPADLRGLDARAFEDVLGRDELVVAFGDGDITGIAAAALVFADYAVVSGDARVHVDTPEAWAGVVCRLGRKAVGWAAMGESQDELVDEVTEQEPRLWLEEWLRHRSVMALDSVAPLIRGRGGDSLERVEFARLFAIGEPRKGLGAFLAKVRPSYS
jgi:hypothetical protein